MKLVSGDDRPEVSANAKSSASVFARERMAGRLFLVGSLLVVLDAGLDFLSGVSLSSLLHLFAGLLFTLGSQLFIPKRSQS